MAAAAALTAPAPANNGVPRPARRGRRALGWRRCDCRQSSSEPRSRRLLTRLGWESENSWFMAALGLGGESSGASLGRVGVGVSVGRRVVSSPQVDDEMLHVAWNVYQIPGLLGAFLYTHKCVQSLDFWVHSDI